MRVKKEFWLALGIVAFVLWTVLISIGVVDLYDTQNVLIDCVDTLQDGMSYLYDTVFDITIDPQVIPYLIPEQDTKDILGIEQVSLSDEAKELVEDLRWKHYPFWVQADILDEWWVQQYPYIKFEDGILYIVDEDVTWFIEMQRKEE